MKTKPPDQTYPTDGGRLVYASRWPTPAIDRRTYLAGQALVGILACEPIAAASAARAAVRAADALIAVLEGREPAA